MSWSRSEFLAILTTNIAKQLFKDNKIAEYVCNFTDDNKAALLHANGITQTSDIDVVLPMLQLVVAFANKDIDRIQYLLYEKKVPTGVRLDYFLPLYVKEIDAGEDIFVASVKVMLNGTRDQDVELSSGNMMHLVTGHDASSINNTPYTQAELSFLEHYVNNSFAIRSLFQSAPNQQIAAPNPAALEYILNNNTSYRDSNHNPVIVFIPGAINIRDYPVANMIEKLIKCKSVVSDIGFFATQGIVWSIILGDVESTKKFIELGADLTREDEMGNKHVIAWAATTYQAVCDQPDYQKRLLTIMHYLLKQCSLNLNCKNNVGRTPLDYLDNNVKLYLLNQSSNDQHSDQITPRDTASSLFSHQYENFTMNSTLPINQNNKMIAR